MKRKVAILLLAFVFYAEASRITEEREQQKSENASSQGNNFVQQDSPAPENAGNVPMRRIAERPSRSACNPFLQVAWQFVKSLLPKND